MQAPKGSSGAVDWSLDLQLPWLLSCEQSWPAQGPTPSAVQCSCPQFCLHLHPRWSPGPIKSETGHSRNPLGPQPKKSSLRFTTPNHLCHTWKGNSLVLTILQEQYNPCTFVRRYSTLEASHHAEEGSPPCSGCGFSVVTH